VSTGEAEAAPASMPPGKRQLTPKAAGFFGLGILVALVGFAAYATFSITNTGTPAAPTDGRIQSIAVLPFADMSPGRDQEYFSDGITEELLDRLTRVEGLHVAARTSSFAFKGLNEDISEIGRKLRVQSVLEGSVRREGDQLRITAQLIDVRTGYHLWSETYDRAASGIFAVQDEISSAIVKALALQLGPADVPPTRSTDNIKAHDLYLLGLSL
jgi:TolB-like protein